MALLLEHVSIFPIPALVYEKVIDFPPILQASLYKYLSYITYKIIEYISYSQ